MDNIEERIKFLKASVALSDLVGPDELTVTVSDLSALIAQLEAAQKEIHGLKMKLSDAGCLLVEWKQRVEQSDRRASTLEAELSAASEKLKGEQVPYGYYSAETETILEQQGHANITKEPGGNWQFPLFTAAKPLVA